MPRPTTLPRTTPAQDPGPATSLPGGDAAACEAWTNRRATAQALRAAHARQISGRRRLVDPATCDRDYSGDEMEFMNAMQEYKKRSGRMFPTWSEVLEVLYGLGYRKSPAAGEPLAG